MVVVADDFMLYKGSLLSRRNANLHPWICVDKCCIDGCECIVALCKMKRSRGIRRYNFESINPIYQNHNCVNLTYLVHIGKEIITHSWFGLVESCWHKIGYQCKIRELHLITNPESYWIWRMSKHIICHVCFTLVSHKMSSITLVSTSNYLTISRSCNHLELSFRSMQPM